MRRKQRVQTPLGRGGRQHISSPGVPGLAGASPWNRSLDDVCGEGQETALKTNSIDRPEVPLCSVAGVLSTQEEEGCPDTTKGYGPTDVQREMLSMTGGHATQRERPGLELGVLLMGIYSLSQIRLFEIHTEKSRWHLVKIHAQEGWVSLVTCLHPGCGS